MVFAFLTSILSATELRGLLFGFKFLINIFEFSLTILPFHLLGRKGLIGEIESFEFKLKMVHELKDYMLYFQLVLRPKLHQRLTF